MKWTALILILSLTSCGKLFGPGAVKITFVNNSAAPAQITLSNGLDMVELNADGNSTASKSLVFSSSLNQDGSYKLHLTSSKKDTSCTFGYYTNGSPLDEEIQITWRNDSLKTKSILKRY